MPDLTFKLVLVTNDASLKLAEVKQEAESTQSAVEKPAAVNITAEQALATIRDVKIAVDGVLQVVGGLVRSMNDLLDASLNQRQAMKLASIVFSEAAGKMVNFASSMQSVTNFKAALRLMEALARLRRTETEKIEAEYQRQLALINEFTQDGSEAKRKAMENFDALKTQQDNEIAIKEKDAV
ncbi:MAG TPA: hypothetical protein PLP86_05715 [Armatimonadota bacterium]|jgi:hypothetical protein|nr:hypothetical protein [Armatimonadota bacterium]